MSNDATAGIGASSNAQRPFAAASNAAAPTTTNHRFSLPPNVLTDEGLASHPVVVQLQNALLAAMEEVDQLRSHIHIEQGKVQREFRETVDLLLANGHIDITGTTKGVSSSPPPGLPPLGAAHYGGDVSARLEAMESTVRALLDRRDLAPISVDKVLQQTKTFLQDTDAEVSNLRVTVDDKMRWLDGKVAEMGKGHHQREMHFQGVFEELQQGQQRALEEALTTMRRREAAVQQQLQQLSSGLVGSARNPLEVAIPPEVELKLSQLAKLTNHLDKRINIMEESYNQLDSEQRDMVTSIHSLKTTLQTERVRNTAPRGIGSPTDLNNETLSSIAVRDEVLRLLENDNLVKVRQQKEEILSIKEEVQKCTLNTERNFGEISRVAQQYQGLQQAVGRSEAQVATIQEKVDAEMRGHFARAEQQQKSFFSRQDQLLANERHQVQVRLSTDLQRMQQKALEEFQQSEARRMEDIRSSHSQLREDFNKFVGDQRNELERHLAAMKDYVNHLTKEQADTLSKQFREVADDTRRTMVGGMDDVKKLASRTSEELKRMKAAVDDNTERLSDQHNYLHSRVQQIMDEEVKRFDRISEDSRLRLAQQIDGEVQRAVSATEGSLVRAYHTIKEEHTRDTRLVKEELDGIRGSLAAIAAPTTTMAAFEARVDTLRRDITQIHVAVSRLQEVESKMQNSLHYEVRKSMDMTKNEVLREVGSQLQRFDRSLSELAQEQQAQYASLVSQQPPSDMISRGLPPQQQYGSHLMASPTSVPRHHQHHVPPAALHNPYGGNYGIAATTTNTRSRASSVASNFRVPAAPSGDDFSGTKRPLAAPSPPATADTDVLSGVLE